MKKVLGLLMIVGFMVPALPARAEGLSCSDLNVIGNGLTDIGNYIAGGGDIVEGSSLDSSLFDIVTGLYLVADLEGDSDLKNTVTNLDQSWVNMDADGFLYSLDSVVDILDYYEDRDCY